MTRRIAIVSGKGGVGKTTTVTNLASVIPLFGKSVIAVDANFTAPNLGLHLGAPINTIHFHHVLREQAEVFDAIHSHPIGFHYIPAGLSLDDIKQVDLDSYLTAIDDITHFYDVMLLDCAPGLGSDAMVGIASATEMLVVVNPEWTSITDAMKTIKFAEEIGVPSTGVILNRKRNETIEPLNDHIETFLDAPILAEIPEDRNVRKGVAYCKPVVHKRPNSRASLVYRKLAANLLGHNYMPRPTWKEKLKEIWHNMRDVY